MSYRSTIVLAAALIVSVQEVARATKPEDRVKVNIIPTNNGIELTIDPIKKKSTWAEVEAVNKAVMQQREETEGELPAWEAHFKNRNQVSQPQNPVSTASWSTSVPKVASNAVNWIYDKYMILDKLGEAGFHQIVNRGEAIVKKEIVRREMERKSVEPNYQNQSVYVYNDGTVSQAPNSTHTTSWQTEQLERGAQKREEYKQEQYRNAARVQEVNQELERRSIDPDFSDTTNCWHTQQQEWAAEERETYEQDREIERAVKKEMNIRSVDPDFSDTTNCWQTQQQEWAAEGRENCAYLQELVKKHLEVIPLAHTYIWKRRLYSTAALTTASLLCGIIYRNWEAIKAKLKPTQESSSADTPSDPQTS